MPTSSISALNAPTGFAGEAQNKVSQSTTVSGGLLALGIVYGDLGTSPLYTLQTIVHIMGDQFKAAEALGSLSLIFWALIITISIKYCLLVMRADNHGEGGILALMTMTGAHWAGRGRWLIVMGLFGAALIYHAGDFGFECGRRSERRNGYFQTVYDADCCRHLGRIVCDPKSGNWLGREGLRTGDVVMVCDNSNPWHCRYRAASGSTGGDQSDLRCATADRSRI